MRHIIITLFALAMGTAGAQAQTEKGRWTIGAQVGDFDYSGGSDGPFPFRSRIFTMSLSPTAGYFVANNLVIGASVPIGYSSTSNSVSSGSRLDSDVSIGLAPFARYYVGSGKLRPFINASIEYQQYWLSRRGFGGGEPVRANFNQTNYSVGGGVAYFINNTVSLDASLNYTNALGNSSIRQPARANMDVGFRLFFGK